MSNLFKRLFKSKSKFLLIILCLLGMIFSYSCSCRADKVTGGGGPDGETDNTEPKILTPSASLSRNVMIVNSAGNDTTYPITITVADADISTFSVSGLDGLELQKNGDDFSVKSGFEKIDTTEKEITLNVNYQKKPTAGAKDTIAEGKDTGEIKFKVLKAKEITDTEIENEIKKMLTIGSFMVSEIKINDGIANIYENEQVDSEINTGDFIKTLNNRVINKKLDIIEGFGFVSVVLSTDKKTATFEFILKVKEQYETRYNSENPISLKVIIGDTDKGQGGKGTWKDTSTK